MIIVHEAHDKGGNLPHEEHSHPESVAEVINLQAKSLHEHASKFATVVPFGLKTCSVS